jgi:LmbE family N-acetylglucosaminyl deacetylase
MIMKNFKYRLILPVFAFFIILPLKAAQLPSLNASEIQLALKKMKVIGSTLYLAAHPDDENTALLAYLSKEKMLQTGYLSITRGDGGQNLIGTEANGLLGILRTQELLSARRIDGAKQFFTRAVDFGYCKTPEEALDTWGKEEILGDIVWIIRQFKPDIIITRFTPDLGGHGHHRASAILAIEAFQAAADPTKFAEQLSTVDVWQPKRIVWNAWRRALEGENVDLTKLPSVDLGSYNSLLGKSYREMSALSRSMHKSQGFGDAPRYGQYLEYFIHLGGDLTRSDIFEGIDTSWRRVPGGSDIPKLLDKSLKEWNSESPSDIIPILLETREKIKELPSSYWKNIKLGELDHIIHACLGLWLEARADDYYVAAGDRLHVTFRALTRTRYPLKLESVEIPFCNRDTLLDKLLDYNLPLEFGSNLPIPTSAEITRPYWLSNASSLGRYNISSTEQTGLAENNPVLEARFTLRLDNETMVFTIPVVYKWTDPVEGERFRQIMISPPAFASFKEKIYIFPNQRSKMIEVAIETLDREYPSEIQFEAPAGWLVEPTRIALNSQEKNSSVQFKVTPPRYSSTVTAGVILPDLYQTPFYKEAVIDYSHIPFQVLFSPTEVKLARINIKPIAVNVGYIMGSGDEIPQILAQMGINVTLLDERNFSTTNLYKFKAIVIGIRAYNTQNWLKTAQPVLMNYVKNGGTLVVQYNVSRGLILDNLGPFPFSISRDRVSREEATVSFLRPNHPILNVPNKIQPADFEGWIQERGLYFAKEWDLLYETPLASNDPGEEARSGGLLYCKYGNGIYIYTGYAFFRQLPAGVSGAFRLFMNMISARASNE